MRSSAKGGACEPPRVGVYVLGRAPGVNREDARQLGTVVAAWKQMAVHSMWVTQTVYFLARHCPCFRGPIGHASPMGARPVQRCDD